MQGANGSEERQAEADRLRTRLEGHEEQRGRAHDEDQQRHGDPSAAHGTSHGTPQQQRGRHEHVDPGRHVRRGVLVGDPPREPRRQNPGTGQNGQPLTRQDRETTRDGVHGSSNRSRRVPPSVYGPRRATAPPTGMHWGPLLVGDLSRLTIDGHREDLRRRRCVDPLSPRAGGRRPFECIHVMQQRA